jgi:hypothetical protein
MTNNPGESANWEGAALVLDEYALRPPRVDPPPLESQQWREIRAQVQELAGRLRALDGTAGELRPTDASFLEGQAGRMKRMHLWIIRDPELSLSSRQVSVLALEIAERLHGIAAMIRVRLEGEDAR